ncbi:MAG: hypothetical protein QW738_04830 [Nitrososphaeria archaeon]
MDQIIDSYIRAGKIAASVLKDIKNRIQPGMTFLEVCDLVEKRIKELGGEPAFTVNI